jgi:signal transduction histidine kinase
MKLATLVRTAALTLLAASSLAFAQERGSIDEAKAMVEKGLAHVKAVGTEKAFADFTDKESGKWQNKDLYVFVVKTDGTTVAHGANKGLLGKSLIELKDPNGKLFIKEMIDVGMKGTGMVEYSFTDPQTKKMAPKQSYVARVPGFDGIIGVGAYKK